nr:MAG TPA_asm: hypothetical protein [Caudoviricetes sp.]
MFCVVSISYGLPPAARPHRSGADHTVCEYLIPLLCGAILPRPLIKLHIARYAHKVAFNMPRQRISLLTKCENTQPESSLSILSGITGQ